MAVLKKLAKIQASVKGLTKNEKAYGYDYVDGNKCLGSIRPLMVELGLLLIPEVKEVTTRDITYKVWNDRAKGLVEKTEVLCTIKMTMTWVDTEDGDTLVNEWAGTGMNAFDKGFGSALTYGERYYLLKFFHIPTDKDDVDALAASRDKAMEMAYNGGAAPAPTNPAPARRKPATSAPKPQESAYTPMDEATYWKIIGAYAAGKKSKTGGDLKQAWIESTHADTEAIEQFDRSVEQYCIAHGIQQQ